MPDLFASLIVATYNQGEFLAECLDSLISQSLPRFEFELIVVNDGSTDATSAVIQEYSSQLDEVISHENQQGLVAACNTGLKQARGRYFIRVDSDDYLEHTALEQLKTAAAKAPSTDIITPAYWILEGQETTILRTDPSNLFTWMAGGVLLNRESVMRAGGYRNYYWEEYDLYLRMLRQGSTVSGISEPILHYRKHGENMTAKKDARVDGWNRLIETWSSAELRRFGNHEELEEILLSDEVR